MQPPKTMTRAQRTSFRRLVDQLTELGIDPAERQALAVDYVHADARIDELRAHEAAARGKAKAAATRSTNVALAERRRLHAALFAGARDGVALPTPADILTAGTQATADAAWWSYFAPTTAESMTASEYRALSERLEAQHGPPSWAALLYRSVEDKAAGEAAIEKYNRTHRQQAK